MNSLEAGRESVKLWFLVKLFELTILGLCVTGLLYLFTLIWSLL